MAHSTRVVILGGGFAGVYAARYLQRRASRRSQPIKVHLVNTSLCVRGTYNVWALGDGALVPLPTTGP